MIINSIAHVFESALQYIALITALFLYRWLTDVIPFSSSLHATKRSHRRYRVLKGRDTHTFILDELLVLYNSMKEWRKKYGLTQEKFAEKMDVDPRTVRRWERDGTQPQPRHVDRFQRIKGELIEKQGSNYNQSNQSVRGEVYNARGHVNWDNHYLYIPPRPRSHILIATLLANVILLAIIVLLVFLALHIWLHIL